MMTSIFPSSAAKKRNSVNHFALLHELLSPFYIEIQHVDEIYRTVYSRKASVCGTDDQLAAKSSCVSSRTGVNRTMKLLGGLSFVGTYKVVMG